MGEEEDKRCGTCQYKRLKNSDKPCRECEDRSEWKPVVRDDYRSYKKR